MGEASITRTIICAHNPSSHSEDSFHQYNSIEKGLPISVFDNKHRGFSNENSESVFQTGNIFIYSKIKEHS